ncbi:MAG: site-specific integrase [Rhodospirillales bacterium]|nr:site-specific integrase [Rhodospirillales bacterium]
MSRPRKGLRLHRKGGKGNWIIVDGETRVSTGTADRGRADAALARYVAEQGRREGPRTGDDVTIGEVLDWYGEGHARGVKAPERIGYSIKALRPWFGPARVSTINRSTCEAYVRHRGVASDTVRTELAHLNAAINWCKDEGRLVTDVRATLPPKAAPRDRWLTRDEVAKLIRACRHRSPHLARFILVAVYTGRRSAALRGLQFMPNMQGGWIDTDRGVLYGLAEGETASRKRKPPAPVPPRLLAHLRRWERTGARWVVEHNGKPVASLKTAWRTALREAGIEHCSPHDLRRTCATWMMQNGADLWAAAGYLGMTVPMLVEVYGHHHPDHMRSAIDALGRR